MEIKVVYKSGDFSFYMNGQLAYTSAKAMLALRYKVSVSAANETAPKFIIKQKSSMLSVSFEIDRGDTSLQFKVASARKHHFQCKSDSDTYDIYGHKIETCSVYKNDAQVAWWDLKYSTDPKIIANSDCDPELLISFYILTNKLIEVRNDGQGIVKPLLTNIFEERPVDPNWQPK
jgi:hypothetical protein